MEMQFYHSENGSALDDLEPHPDYELYHNSSFVDDDQEFPNDGLSSISNRLSPGIADNYGYLGQPDPNKYIGNASPNSITTWSELDILPPIQCDESSFQNNEHLLTSEMEEERQRIEEPNSHFSYQYYTLKRAQIDARNLFNLSEIVDERPDLSNSYYRTKRQCWCKCCWSKTYHAHAIARSSRVGDDDNRNQLQSKYGAAASNQISKHSQDRKSWVQFKEIMLEFFMDLEIWRHSIKQIEGHFGTSLASYFILIRWSLLLNLAIFLVIFIFIVLPQVTISGTYNFNATDGHVEECSMLYDDSLSNTKSDGLSYVINFLQGTGWMEGTSMFIGFYRNSVIRYKWGVTYNLPLAYICTILVVLLISLIHMLRTTAKGIKEGAIVSEGKLHNYCNTIFAGWDFCITKDKTANLKHVLLTKELQSFLENEKLKTEHKGRSRKENAILFLKRFVINIIIIASLCGGCYAIHKVSDYSLEQLQSYHKSNGTSNDLKVLSTQYLPSFVITVMNIILPIFFYKLIEFEKYLPGKVINMNLARTVVLRLASIGVLLFSFQSQISKLDNSRCGASCTDNSECSKLLCWETYIGQQIYKLVILDFIIGFVLTFGIGYIRKILVTKTRVFKFIGQEIFDIPQNVLDLVYSQTLCWLGVFFSPMLPVACILKFIIFFYVKKFHLLINCEQSSQPYRASKSNSFFMIVLLLCFSILVLLPLTYSISSFLPSKGCSPFRTNEESIWELIPNTINAGPNFVLQIITFITSAGFAIPMIIILMLIIYYYYTVAAAYKTMGVVLKDHLIMEGKDKQFILNRLQDITINARQQSRAEAKNNTLRHRSYSNN